MVKLFGFLAVPVTHGKVSLMLLPFMSADNGFHLKFWDTDQTALLHNVAFLDQGFSNLGARAPPFKKKKKETFQAPSYNPSHLYF